MTQNNSVESASIAPYAMHVGDRTAAVWLPNEVVARAWLALMLGQGINPDAPSVQITSPAPLVTFRATRIGETINIPIAATAMARPGHRIVSVTFGTDRSGDILLGVDTTAPYATAWSLEAFASSNVGGREHFNLTATAVDKKGNRGYADWVPIDVILPVTDGGVSSPRRDAGAARDADPMRDTAAGRDPRFANDVGVVPELNSVRDGGLGIPGGGGQSCPKYLVSHPKGALVPPEAARTMSG